MRCLDVIDSIASSAEGAEYAIDPVTGKAKDAADAP